jgi:predicted lipoprotein with Yx(FWY)xxD motif
MFDSDSPTVSACNTGCSQVWPPVEGPVTGEGIDAAHLGTITRDDGTVQATFFGHPVYRYTIDTGPGSTKGQGAVGGTWWVLDGSGDAVRHDTATGGTPTTAKAGGY